MRPVGDNMSPPIAAPDTKDVTVALDGNSVAIQSAENQVFSGLIGHVKERFQRSLTARRPYETRWIEAWNNFRGIYGPAVAFREDEKSRAFIKVTKTKALAAFGQIIDVLLADNNF